MPELPEVETVLRTLETNIKGSKIIDIKVLYSNIVEEDIASFKAQLINQHFVNFKRRGKYLLFEMDDITLVSHLRMEGKYYIVNDENFNKHDHVIFYLDDGRILKYNDVRKFGRMSLISKDDEYLDFNNLGPEPFSSYFNLEYCKHYFKDNKAVIKKVLLDQSFVAGIGNIYADEILFASKLNPELKCSTLNGTDIENLIENTKQILHNAILKGGTTIRSYTSSLGVTGLFQLDLMVHTKKTCKICNSSIIKTRVATRGTYYCPNCQRKYRKIAITGTIGSGKTTVLNYLKKNNFYFFDCDLENKKLLEKNNIGYLKVKEVFKEAFDNDELNKAKLASIIFNDKDKKKMLENIMHPLILDNLNKINDYPLIAEVPLLFESKWDKYFDTNLLVVTSEKISLKRLKDRGLNKKEAQERIVLQMSAKEKSSRADEIIYNNGSLIELYEALDIWLKKYVG